MVFSPLRASCSGLSEPTVGSRLPGSVARLTSARAPTRVRRSARDEAPRRGGGGGENGDDDEDGRDAGPAANSEEGAGELEFSGIVASVTADATSTTVVLEDGTSFLVQEGTEVRGEIIVGASVTVKAAESDGVRVATEVKVEGAEGGDGS